MSALPSDPCDTKSNLLSEYSLATKVYSDSVTEITSKIGAVNAAEYQKLINLSEKYREICNEARQRLERHIAEHGC